jgi:anion-transporting  ArsA/GET3 family ATPase
MLQNKIYKYFDMLGSCNICKIDVLDCAVVFRELEKYLFSRDLVEMEKEQLSKQNQQLTFDLEKAREAIQNKNKDNLKVSITGQDSVRLLS